MTDQTVLAGAIGVAVGVLLALALILIRRLARGSRDLGGEVERATSRTLHVAGLAAAELRGASGPDLPRAARHLRTLLGAQAVAIVLADGEVATDGPVTGLETSARRIAERVRETGRRQVFPRRDARDGTQYEAVGAPILVEGQVRGVLIAFADAVRGPLVRATGEVAEWCASQIVLADLEVSRASLAEAELRALRAQISPHFIYNSLAAIASFITTDPERARTLVLDFADFTRYSFRQKGEFTTLAQELVSIRHYLELERARFGERLDVRLRIAPETLSTVIPFLSVQPLVENAVRHGLEPLADGGRIVIAAADEMTHTEISVEDDGAGMDPDVVQRALSGPVLSTHVGLRNVDTRLRRLYGRAGGLVVETNIGAGTMVRMRIPKSQPLHETEAP
ncbi:sensor histidine kinase [Microbacterium suwonense]|uniref:Signal transduction histidine kinase n=1 Tax=Microbacterium suwonense TaxID=683047 RepID=A0ABM8FXP3_9MICO|nr:sensor histidine kinase [Microbacterium suwonense]BDZ40506.1 signal transduction histidine kinase [Microbacterium suwonense]